MKNQTGEGLAASKLANLMKVIILADEAGNSEKNQEPSPQLGWSVCDVFSGIGY